MSEEEVKREKESKIKMQRYQIAQASCTLNTINIIFIDTEYNENQQKRNHTSFGKLILAQEKANPIFSFGSANRFAMTTGFNNSSINTPGPQYNPSNTEVYKYKTSQKWRMGKANRLSLAKQRFEHYNHPYDQKDDLSILPKKWNRLSGGAISLQNKFKVDLMEKTPGPGRYDPTFSNKPKTPTYYITGKNQHKNMQLLTGTNEIVGPGRYSNDCEQNKSHHPRPPRWKIGNEKRRGLLNKVWTVNETFESYSSCGFQVRTKQRTEPVISIGYATRNNENKRGLFKNMMDRPPIRISLPMPKI